MPSNWKSIDDGFPTFTGKETTDQKITALQNYLYKMREGLQYSLQNLTAENFNSTAWDKVTEEQKDKVTQEVQRMYALMNQLNARLESIAGRMTTMEDSYGKLEADVTGLKADSEALGGRVTELEENQALLEGRVETAEADAAQLRELIGTAEADIDALTQDQEETKTAVAAIQEAVQVLEDGSIQLGKEGAVVNIVGVVSINGTLWEQGGSA